MSLSLVTAAASEPVTTQQLKDWFRVQHNAEDAQIGSLGKSARAVIEKYLRRALVTQTWKQFMDGFPVTIELRLNPVASITHVKYYDTSGTQQTLTADTDYVSDLAQEPARIVPAFGKVWPPTRYGQLAQVEVQFVAGYGASTAVPDAIITAIKDLALYWYDNRGAVTESIPAGIKSKILDYRVFSFYEG